MFKYELDQLIFYYKDNRPHSAKVLTRMCVENAHNDWTSTPEQKALFTPLGPSRKIYCTVHGEIEEENAFSSKENLIEGFVSSL